MELGKATTFGQRYDDGDAHVVEIGEQFVDMSALVLALVWDSVSVPQFTFATRARASRPSVQAARVRCHRAIHGRGHSVRIRCVRRLGSDKGKHDSCYYLNSGTKLWD